MEEISDDSVGKSILAEQAVEIQQMQGYKKLLPVDYP
jgi:hypothetical protein